MAKSLCKDKNKYRYIPSTITFDYLPKKNRKIDAQSVADAQKHMETIRAIIVDILRLYATEFPTPYAGFKEGREDSLIPDG